MKIKLLYSAIFLLNFTINSFSQNIDELETYLNQLENAHEKQKPEICNKIAWYYRTESKENSIKYAEKALTIANKLLEAYQKEEGDASQKKVGIYVLEKEKAESNYVLGFINLRQEKFDEALNYQYKSLDIYSRINEEYPHDIEAKQYIANLLNDIGYIYKSIGRYDEAIKNYKMAIQINDEMGLLNETGVNYNNLGVVYNKTLQYQESASSFNNALDIAKELNQEQNVAVQYNNVGQIFLSIGDYQKAKENFSKSLATCEKYDLGENQKASVLTNLGMAELSSGNFDGAIEYFEQAKTIFDSTGYEAGVATQLNNIGLAHKTAGNYEKILPYFNEAMEINKKIGAGDSYAKNLSEMGDVHAANKELDQAIDQYEKSLIIYDQLKAEASSLKLHFLIEEQLNVYDKLINAYLLNGNQEKALFTMEMARSKSFAEQFNINFQEFFIPTVKELQEELTSDDILFDFEYLDKNSLTAFVITKDNFEIQSLNKALLIQNFNDIFLSVSGSRGSFFKPSKYGRFEDKDEFNSILHYYRKLLMDPEPDDNTQTKRIYLSKIIYNFLFEKSESKIASKKKLYILANGALQSIPFETLVSPNEKYLLIEKDIAYIPSLSSLRQINKRNYPNFRKDLLIVHSNMDVKKSLKIAEEELIPSIYKNNQFANMQVSIADEPLLNEDQIFYLRRKIDDLLNQDTSLIKVYKWLGYKASKVPTSKTKDLTSIAENFRKSDLEADIDEKKLLSLSNDGDISEYSYLYFAMPGIGFPEINTLNALVLEPNSNEDGLFNIYEVPKLKLKANAICLPDYNTDDRKNYVGDGAVPFAASLIHAGCNAVNISYWKTDDDSKYFFINEVFKLLSNDENMTINNAMMEVKRKMIRWEYDKALSNPYYWATYMYFGK